MRCIALKNGMPRRSVNGAARFAAALSVALALTSPGTAAARAVAPAPALAQDGRGLFGESPDTQALFTAVWGARAAEEWVQEHDAALSGGEAPSGPRIGFLYSASASTNTGFTQGLVAGLRKAGYEPGRTISILWRFGDGQEERLPGLAAELVEQGVDVIVAAAMPDAVAARQATSRIPIVTMTVGDPVGSGLVSSVERPGGNVTGVLQQPPGFNVERLSVLTEAVPQATRIGVLVPATSMSALDPLEEAAPSLGVAITPLPVRTADDLPGAFILATDEGVQALLVLPGTVFSASRRQIVQFAAEQRLPALTESGPFTEAGGLMQYGFSLDTRSARAAEYVAAILHGGSPADLPMEAPPTFEFVVNLSAARAIGYEFPPSILDRATESIR